KVIAQAGSVRQQLMDCDLPGDFFIRIVGQVLDKRVLEGQLALLSELSDRDGREHFVHGTEVELGVQLIADVEGPAGKAACLGKKWLAVMCEHYRAGKQVGGDHFVKERLDAFCGIGITEFSL